MELNIKSTITIVMTFVIGVILIMGVLVPIINDNSGSGGGSGQTYTNVGLPMMNLTDFEDLEEDKSYAISNLDENDDKTDHIYLYELTFVGNEETRTNIGTIAKNNTDDHVYVQLLVTDYLTITWEIDNSIAPQSNSICICDANHQFGTYSLPESTLYIEIGMYEGAISVFFNAFVQDDDQWGYEITEEYGETPVGYIYHPDGDYVLTTVGESGTAIHWSNSGWGLAFDGVSTVVGADLTTTDFAFVLSDESGNGLSYYFTEQGIENTIYSKGVTTSGNISTVTAELTDDPTIEYNGFGIKSIIPDAGTEYGNMQQYILPATVAGGSGGGSGSNGTIDAMLYLIPVLMIAGMIILGLNMILKKN